MDTPGPVIATYWKNVENLGLNPLELGVSYFRNNASKGCVAFLGPFTWIMDCAAAFVYTSLFQIICEIQM
jgi:hypothetical protein